LPEIECDPEQIKQVLLNLVMNAVQALDQAGSVTISAEVKDSRLVIDVSDNGPGVPLEDVDRLFSPFYTTKPNGTGLGLPVAQQIVLRHGGVIMVGPNSPRGAVFSVMLPLERPRA
jgi:signal transduction histidine kinase